MTDHELQLKSFALRRRMLQLIFDAGAGHTGGGLSCLDILNVLYNRILQVTPETVDSPTRDRYVQSKGHCVEALYAVMADRGYFPDADLNTVCHYKSYYVGHPTRKIRGVEMNTGALGHGLPICLGMGVQAIEFVRKGACIHDFPTQTARTKSTRFSMWGLCPEPAIVSIIERGK